MDMDKDKDYVEDGDDDFTLPPREALHTEPELCKTLLRSVTSSVPLAIRSSNISLGSGLFVDKPIEEGREIYRSEPFMSAIDIGNPSFCHYCLKDASDAVDNGTGQRSEAKACMGCKVARFCSKKCQKAAWSKFHKDECSTMRNVPKMTAQHLLVHRLIFWQQRKFITTSQGKAIEMLETHFYDYTKNGERNGEILDMGVAIRQATGGRVNMGLTWRMVPAFRANCVRVRPASKKESIGAALDLVTATINHSCDPNAFVFFEGNQLRVRSLKRIAAGDEITICYVDPTIDVVMRQELLKRDHFFDCYCSRCKTENKEYSALLKTKAELDSFHRAQRDILDLMHSAMVAARYPGLHPKFEDISGIETQLRTITRSVFPESQWPDHIEPLPSARLCIASLHQAMNKLAPALRSATRGNLMSRRRSGPEFVNEMLDVIFILMVVGHLPPDAPFFEDKSLPTVIDLWNVTYGYLHETCKEAGGAFGGDSGYTKMICDMFASMVAKKPDPKPGSKEFEKDFEAAQGKLMAWAAIPSSYGIII